MCVYIYVYICIYIYIYINTYLYGNSSRWQVGWGGLGAHTQTLSLLDSRKVRVGGGPSVTKGMHYVLVYSEVCFKMPRF